MPGGGLPVELSCVAGSMDDVAQLVAIAFDRRASGPEGPNLAAPAPEGLIGLVSSLFFSGQ